MLRYDFDKAWGLILEILCVRYAKDTACIGCDHVSVKIGSKLTEKILNFRYLGFGGRLFELPVNVITIT